MSNFKTEDLKFLIEIFLKRLQVKVMLSILTTITASNDKETFFLLISSYHLSSSSSGTLLLSNQSQDHTNLKGFYKVFDVYPE